MTLPYDVMRCYGGSANVPPYTICVRKESCARYRNRFDLGEQTLIADSACFWYGKIFEDHYIKDDSVSS